MRQRRKRGRPSRRRSTLPTMRATNDLVLSSFSFSLQCLDSLNHAASLNPRVSICHWIFEYAGSCPPHYRARVFGGPLYEPVGVVHSVGLHQLRCSAVYHRPAQLSSEAQTPFVGGDRGPAGTQRRERYEDAPSARQREGWARAECSPRPPKPRRPVMRARHYLCLVSTDDACFPAIDPRLLLWYNCAVTRHRRQ